MKDSLIQTAIEEFNGKFYIPCEGACESNINPLGKCNCNTPKTTKEIESWLISTLTNIESEAREEERERIIREMKEIIFNPESTVFNMTIERRNVIFLTIESLIKKGVENGYKK